MWIFTLHGIELSYLLIQGSCYNICIQQPVLRMLLQVTVGIQYNTDSIALVGSMLDKENYFSAEETMQVHLMSALFHWP
jgi:hypothetical protein